MTALRRGQRFTMAGRRWRVLFVSECRAHCEAVIRQPVSVMTSSGNVRTWTATRRITIDISPNSAIESLGEAERAR